MPDWLLMTLLSLSIVALGLAICGILRTLNTIHRRVVELEKSVNLLKRFAATWSTSHR